jgi:hypothetical protein
MPDVTARNRDHEVDGDLFALLLDAHQALALHTSEVASFLRSQQVNRVLFSGLVILGADGTWSPETGFVVPYASILCANHHATDPVYVINEQPSGYLPVLTLGASGQGFAQQGVQRIDGKSTRQFPLTGTRVSIVGTAATVVSLAVISAGLTGALGT